MLAIIFSSVLFPLPFGPINEIIPLSAIEKLSISSLNLVLYENARFFISSFTIYTLLNI